MNHLHRELAPVSAAAWEEIETEARRALKLHLAGRRVVDFEGPLGWAASAVGTGRTRDVRGTPHGKARVALREVQPLAELRVPFELSRAELDAIDRGAGDADLKPLTAAALDLALAEDACIFNGFPAAGIQGIGEAARGRELTIPADYADYPRVVAEALTRFVADGIEGPYAIALGPRCYVGLVSTLVGGYAVVEHVRRLLDGPIVRADAIDGAIVLSMRGGDFALSVGQDISIGYASHDARTVSLYLEESLTFRVLTPEAAIPLRYPQGRKK